MEVGWYRKRNFGKQHKYCRKRKSLRTLAGTPKWAGSKSFQGKAYNCPESLEKLPLLSKPATSKKVFVKRLKPMKMVTSLLPSRCHARPTWSAFNPETDSEEHPSQQLFQNWQVILTKRSLVLLSY